MDDVGIARLLLRHGAKTSLSIREAVGQQACMVGLTAYDIAVKVGALPMVELLGGATQPN